MIKSSEKALKEIDELNFSDFLKYLSMSEFNSILSFKNEVS